MSNTLSNSITLYKDDYVRYVVSSESVGSEVNMVSMEPVSSSISVTVTKAPPVVVPEDTVTVEMPRSVAGVKLTF